MSTGSDSISIVEPSPASLPHDDPFDSDNEMRRADLHDSVNSPLLSPPMPARKGRRGSILKRRPSEGSDPEIIKDPRIARIRDQPRRVSWSDIHHGQTLTQVREVDYHESKWHRIYRQHKATVILFGLALFATILILILIIAIPSG
eukprot:TRINITY_DN10061_c0_g1_i2.p1 TRINITY_DN10061_c0_g1~~TRINITY_DN10061_c0_g1_i2.p1  ORF type:complete len:161 (+),score=13.98 TRINITY_DN10061_c0_g1_i2:48-485(+)